MTRKPSFVSDKKLSQALKSLREEVAAPANFSSQIMQRLRNEGVLPKLPQEAAPSFWSRFKFELSPARLGLAGASLAALAVALWMAPKPKQEVAPEIKVVETTVAKAPAPKSGPVLARNPKAAPAPAQAEAVVAPAFVEETVVGQVETAPVESAPVAVGNAPAPTVNSSRSIAAPAPSNNYEAPQISLGSLPGNSSSIQAASVEGKPTVIVVYPTATPMVKPIQGNSEVRGNVVRASQGEAALVLFKVLKQGKVRAEIFGRLGQRIAVLKDSDLAPGEYELRWAGQSEDGNLAPSGIYVLHLTAPGYAAEHKILLVK